MTLVRANNFEIGQTVFYIAYAGAPPEAGTVHSINEQNVFVRYSNQETAKATSPSDLFIEKNDD